MRDPLGKLRADMALSLDVLYHLVEDEVRDAYLERLFQAGSRFVVIFSSDGPSPTFGAAHERHRAFTPWVREHCPEWSLVEHIPNPYPMGNAGDDQQTSPADFFVFRRNASAAKEPS